MVQSGHMRRMPKQERGERRMQLLLSAAEQVFAEVGYKAATTNEIAARAHTSIGTLYRFFPHKEAIVQHLTEAYVVELQRVHEKMFQPEVATMPLAQMIDHLIDPIVELKTSHPGFVSLFTGPHATMQIPAEIQMVQDQSVRLIEKLWATRFPQIGAEACHLYAVIFFQIVQPLLSLAFSSVNPSPEQIINELKINLFYYLQQVENGARKL
jgi:AcrR family transcriptional regulator